MKNKRPNSIAPIKSSSNNGSTRANSTRACPGDFMNALCFFLFVTNKAFLQMQKPTGYNRYPDFVDILYNKTNRTPNPIF
jgi:hypothetical protein